MTNHSSSKLASTLSTLARINVKTVEGWVNQWGLEDKRARDLFLVLADLVKVRTDLSKQLDRTQLVMD